MTDPSTARITPMDIIRMYETGETYEELKKRKRKLYTYFCEKERLEQEIQTLPEGRRRVKKIARLQLVQEYIEQLKGAQNDTY